MRAMATQVVCQVCGGPVTVPRRGPVGKFCSPSCRSRARYVPRPADPEARARAARVAATAKWSRLDAESRSAVMSAVARARYPDPAAARPTRTQRACRFCGVVTRMSSNQQSCGSVSCRLARNAERNRKYAAARRAITRGVEAEVFEPADIYERDGWVCGICDRPVEKAAKWPDPMSVSLDHIIPLSRGGKHVPDNARCSHLVCNTRRGNRFK